METEAMTAVDPVRTPALDSARTQTVRATREPEHHDGLLGSALALSLGMFESGLRASAKLARSGSSDAQRLVDAALGFGEQAAQTLFRNARSTNAVVFQLAGEVVDRGEQAALIMLGQGQYATDRAAEIAAQATHAVVGPLGTRGPNGSAQGR